MNKEFLSRILHARYAFIKYKTDFGVANWVSTSVFALRS
jgi:hypothetical protein